MSLLRYAASNASKTTVEWLLDRGLAVDQRDSLGETPLFGAVGNSCETTETLLIHGANVNAADLELETPLHVAANWACIATIKLLIAKGAKIDARCVRGRTPLHYAQHPLPDLDVSMNTNSEACRLLLDIGAQVDPMDNDGETPLLLAARKGELVQSELLLKSGADVNAYSGPMSLMFKALYRMRSPTYEVPRSLSLDKAVLLLRHGARFDGTDTEGRTLPEIAKRAGHRELSDLLHRVESERENSGPEALDMNSLLRTWSDETGYRIRGL